MIRYVRTVLILAGCILLPSIVFAQKTVSLATLEWEPYIGENMQDKGYVYEIVVEAFELLGYDADVNFYPWARALKLTLEGSCDGIFPEYYEKGRRDSQVVFSDPFPGGPVGLYKRKDKDISYPYDPVKNLPEVLRELQGYKFGVVQGYINTEVFDNATFLIKEEAVDDRMNLLKLYRGRIDLIFIDKYVAGYILRHHMPEYMDELEFMEPALEIKPLLIAFSVKAPGYKAKLADFNKGLKLITANGTLKRIMRKHGFPDP